MPWQRDPASRAALNREGKRANIDLWHFLPAGPVAQPGQPAQWLASGAGTTREQGPGATQGSAGNARVTVEELDDNGNSGGQRQHPARDGEHTGDVT